MNSRATPLITTEPAKAPPVSSARARVLQRKCTCGGGGTDCEVCKKKGPKEQSLQRKANAGPSPHTPPAAVHKVLSSPGRPLDPATRSFMEPRFSRKFEDVRIHSDGAAGESARAVNARAYTFGQHIVFDSGQYDPGTAGGRELLAHELVHTVQQHGLQRSSSEISLNESGEYHQLEQEADRVSQAVLSPSALASVPAITSTPTQTQISRAKADKGRDPDEVRTAKSKPPVKGGDSKADWRTPGPKMTQARVKQYALPNAEAGGDLVAVQMKDALQLPAEKGRKDPVEQLWKARAEAGGLEALLVAGEDVPRTKAGLKQERPPTSQLREIWRAKVRWTAADAPTNWQKAGGDKADFDTPKAGGKTCQVDHTLELQFGGNNVPANMQMLDGKENMQSGREIFNNLKKLAEQISAAVKEDLPDAGKIQQVLIHYDDISQAGETCQACCEVEKNSTNETEIKKRKIKVLGAGESIGGQKGKTYPITSKSIPAQIFVVDESQKAIPLEESDIPENKSASTIISGLILSEWNRVGKGGGTIAARVDAGEKGRLPVTLTKGEKVILNRANDEAGTLSLQKGSVAIGFTLGGLSEGVFTHLALEKDGSLSGKGTITPSFAFLPKPIDVEFDKEKFELSGQIPKEKLHVPIPGVKITEARIGLQIAPQFKPEGRVSFELATGKKKLLDGSITVTGDSAGILAEGKVNASIPGVDRAEGTLKLQNKQWSGKIVIETAQIKNKLKYVESGSVEINFSDNGMTAEGTVILKLPGTKGVTAKLLYDTSKKQWTFKGTGTFQIPRLKEAELEIEYDGDHLSGGTGSAGIGFEFHGLTGTLHLHYRDEKFSGKGKLDIHKGKAHGSLEVVMHEGKENPTFSGKGEISYPLTPNLTATAGIEIDENEHVRLMGALEFPKPIPLFKPIEGHYKFFEVGVSIPIPGASIGPVGLKARIDGALSAGYKIGPGELRDTKITAAFNPLDEKPDADVLLTSTLFIGAHAEISGSISGSIVVDAVIASVSGGLTITATASLDGHVSSQATIHYQKSRLEVDANFEMLVGLTILLALDAFVKAKAGIGPFSVEKEKVWNLASKKFDTGLQFGMKLKNPIHYASDQPMKLPSFDDIEWTIPKIEPGNILDNVFKSSSSKEEEVKK